VAKRPEYGRIAENTAQALVAFVVGAERVAVHQQHGLAVEIDDAAILEQYGAGFGAESASDEKVPIAVHHEQRDAGVGQGAQRQNDFTGRRIGVVVTEPGFEQVTEDVQRVSPARIVCKKLEELPRNRWIGRIEMKIRYEQYLRRAQPVHRRSRVPAMARDGKATVTVTASTSAGRNGAIR